MFLNNLSEPSARYYLVSHPLLLIDSGWFGLGHLTELLEESGPGQKLA
jgi:hypothetical protein